MRFQQIGIPVIDNRCAYLTKSGLALAGRAPRDSIALAGLGDLWQDPGTFSNILADVHPSIARIVLSHNPDTAELPDAKDFRVDLMLAGHTHGGQVWVPGLGTPVVPSQYGQKYAGGLCAGPHFPVLVSRGVGMAVMPVRFGVPAEISVIELRTSS
jgi:predicted MPP superfamily phosphohydrolase